MYKKFYQLQIDPFRLAPDPRFSYDHPSYSAAYRHLHDALAQEECFAVIAARPGTGKTTLTETFIASLDSSRFLVGRLVTTQVDTTELLRLIAYAFGLEIEGLDRAATLHRLEAHLRAQRDAGRRALLIVDEAQGLGVEALEQLRLLSNLQHQDRTLLQIFLVGQEQLHGLLTEPRLEQLQQRIVAVCRLHALTLDEVRDYVHHRLCVAGWRGDPGIESACFILIHRFSQGLPRYINRLCSRLLLHGALEQKHRLDIADVAAVLLDLSEELLTPVHDQPGPEGNSNRELLYAVAGNEDWRGMLSPRELAFLDKPVFQPPPVLRTQPPPAAPTETAVDPIATAAPTRNWLRWLAAAAAVVALALPFVAFYGDPVNAIAASIGLLKPQPEHPQRTDRAPPTGPAANRGTIAPTPAPADAPTASVEQGDAAAKPDSTGDAFELQMLASVTPSLSNGVTVANALPAPASAPTQAAAPAAATPSPDDSADAQTAALLNRIQEAFEDDRLTRPRGQSAYDLLQQLRQQQPGHPEVEAGLDRIARRYAVLARWWMDKNEYGKASRLMERGLQVRPRSAELHALRQEMHALVLRQRQPSPFPSAFEDSARNESTAAATEPAPASKPNLFTRLKALLRGNADDNP